MVIGSQVDVEARTANFKERLKTEREFCEQLFKFHTIRILAHKYLYYIHSAPIVEDKAYDIEEKSWYIMGRALEVITEDQTSPCVDFDLSHPLAEEAIKIAERYLE